jgi:hypothetical protein
MNTRTLVLIAVAAAGFALGWGFKPTTQTGSVAASDEAILGARGNGGMEQIRSGHSSRPVISKAVAAPIMPSAAVAAARQPELEKAFRSASSVRDRAKLIRMAEALGLSAEQLDQFDALLAEQRERPVENGPGLTPKARLEKMAESAKAFDARFRALLGPQQTAALDGLRARQVENRTEARAQRELADFIDRVDVSAEQREAVAGVLRKSAAAESAKLPAGVDLLMETGIFPSGVGSISDRSISAMVALGDDHAALTDPSAVSRKMNDLQREKVLSRALVLEGILTPAQLAQYRAVAEAQNAFNGTSGPAQKP